MQHPNDIAETLTQAVVRFQVEGWHYWPEAPANRAYLGKPHRHLFYIEVRVEVYHEHREIEYHDLLDFCKSVFPGGDMGPQSCETMAHTLAKAVSAHYPERFVETHVFEDGEVGSVVKRLWFPI